MEYALYILIAGIVACVIGLLVISYKKANEDGVVTKDEFLEILEKEVKEAPKEIKQRVQHYIDVAKFKAEERKKKWLQAQMTNLNLYSF